MPRDIPVGNGRLLVNFDNEYNVRDIYYPHVGKANHSYRCVSRTGIWVDDQFSWFSDPQWVKKIDYLPDTLVTNVTVANDSLGLRVVFNDVVDFHRDVFIRRVQVHNLFSRPREIRVFFHYDLQFWEVGRGDSIQYHPFDDALIAYKDDCYFLMNASLGDVVGVAGWTTGSKNQNRQGGSWQDAHDGVLEKVSTSFGSIDGVISIHQPRLAPQSSETFYTWLASGRDQHEVRFLNFIVSHRKPQYFIDRTASYWQAWVNKEDIDFCDLPEHVVKLYKQSLLITRTHVDENGGIVAGNDSDFIAVADGFESYSYVWPRDGAYIANALDKAGYAFLSARFYDFCADVIYRGQNIRDYQEVYDETAYMLHKYTPDRLAASNWMPLIDEHGNHHLPIQEDETALIPYCLWQHYLKFRDIESIKPWFRPLIIQTANFLVKFRDPVTNLPSPSFDLWEERRAVYSYTSATVWAGLNASANFADMFGELEEARKFRQAAAEIKQACETYLYDEDQGRFLKSVFVAEDGELIKDYTIDASLYGLWYFGMFEAGDPKIQRTMNAVEQQLTCQTEIGGLARYQGDEYHWDEEIRESRDKIPGNPWVICTLWLAQYNIRKARTRDELNSAVPILEWVCNRALRSGVLAEQYHPLTGEPRGVSPLTWSHATLVATVREYIDRYQELS